MKQLIRIIRRETLASVADNISNLNVSGNEFRLLQGNK